MKAKGPRTSPGRRSGVPFRSVGEQTEEYYRRLYQLLESPLRLERAVEMLLHAYSYVREVDPAGESGAANLLWSKYEEVATRWAR